MNPDQNLQYLAFPRLEYAITQVNFWLGQEIDYFVFVSYFPATEDPNKPLYLCCFAQKDGGYLNSYNPDLLAPYPNEVLMLAGPLKLTSNLVSAEAMANFLKTINSDDNFLLFTPQVDGYGQVSYAITAFQHSDTGDVFDSGSLNTNPSPPATEMVEIDN
jgi:hypothetical protein